MRLFAGKDGFRSKSAQEDANGTMFGKRALAAGIVGLAVALGAVRMSSAAAAPPSKVALACVNPVNGVSWQITIDYGNSTVDTNPAKITADEITWYDPTESSNYTLDRETGKLTAIVASSTGGYFRYARCRLGKPR